VLTESAAPIRIALGSLRYNEEDGFLGGNAFAKWCCHSAIEFSDTTTLV